jgi:hypothetical protein
MDPPRSPNRALQRDTHLIHLSKYPVNDPPFQVRHWGPDGKMPFIRAFYTTFRVPSKGVPSSRFPTVLQKCSVMATVLMLIHKTM